jgi:hypothetical protein
MKLTVGRSYSQIAQQQLAATDYVAVRCGELGMTVPEEWRAYRESLREVVRGNSSVLPGPPPLKPWDAPQPEA